MTRKLEGRAALVTGGSRGLGLGIVRAYLDAGAGVFFCARDKTGLEQTVAALSNTADIGNFGATTADISQTDDVRRVVRMAVERFPQLDILVNNAGVQGPMGPLEDADWTDWVQTVVVNLFAPVYFCRALVPHFKALGFGKIIQISGGGATAPMPGMSAYAASKAGVVRFVETLAQELRPSKIDVNAIAPGALNTRMLDEVLAAGPDKIGRARYEQALEQKADGGAPVDRAAALAVFLASRASDGITGRLISAVWDPWEDLASLKADLERTDIYTLRRIVPEDRGFDWGKS